jgi:predicted nuclease of predicted toxin-antitoxin system
VIWLAVGNAGTEAIAKILTEEVQTVREFFAQPEEGLLILEQTGSPA